MKPSSFWTSWGDYSCDPPGPKKLNAKLAKAGKPPLKEPPEPETGTANRRLGVTASSTSWTSSRIAPLANQRCGTLPCRVELKIVPACTPRIQRVR